MILKTDISDHFLIYFLLPTPTASEENKTIYITKRIINNDTIKSSKQVLFKTSWDYIENNNNPNEAYTFLNKLIVLYNQYFPKKM